MVLPFFGRQQSHNSLEYKRESIVFMEQQQQQQQQQYDSNYYEELLRCVYSVYSSLESSCVADYKNAFIKYVSDCTTRGVEDMFNSHCRGLCSCGFDVYVAKGPNCWIDGVKYVSYEQYLSEVGHSSYYARVQDSVVGEVVELSPEC